MKLLFWLKDKPALRVFKVAEGDTVKFLQLADAADIDGHRRENRYHLWKFIEALFPETKTSNWTWKIIEQIRVEVREYTSNPWD
jgi:hypothetical protein